MAYTPTLWAKGDIVTSEKLNKIEQGIVDKVDKVNGKTLSTNDYTNEDKAKLNGLESQIDHLESLVGSPLVASTAADMTDEDKVYVYTGSETGYQSGNWYYYNGTTWTSGGVYNSVAFETDDTLSTQGMAADAKKTGDELLDLKEDLSNVKNGISGSTITLTSSDFQQGYWNVNSTFVSSETKRIGIIDYITVSASDTISYDMPTGWNVAFKLYSGIPGTVQTAVDQSDWLEGSGEYTSSINGYIVLNVRNRNNTITPSDYQGDIAYEREEELPFITTINSKLDPLYSRYEAQQTATDYIIDSAFGKLAIGLSLLGTLSAVQSFCVYNGKYYSTDGTNLYEQDSSFNLVSTTALSLGHGNSMQLGSNGKAYVCGWDDGNVYVVDLANKAIINTIELPVTGYTNCVVDDVNELAYIFQRATYPSTIEHYNFIVYDYTNDNIVSSKKLTRPLAAMQACDFVDGKIVVTYGLGSESAPNGYIVLNTNGDVIAEYILETFATTEPEGVFVDRSTFEILISFVDKKVYKVAQI